jgi:hypothetical protein
MGFVHLQAKCVGSQSDTQLASFQKGSVITEQKENISGKI